MASTYQPVSLTLVLHDPLYSFVGYKDKNAVDLIGRYVCGDSSIDSAIEPRNSRTTRIRLERLPITVHPNVALLL